MNILNLTGFALVFCAPIGSEGSIELPPAGPKPTVVRAEGADALPLRNIPVRSAARATQIAGALFWAVEVEQAEGVVVGGDVAAAIEAGLWPGGWPKGVRLFRPLPLVAPRTPGQFCPGLEEVVVP